MWWLYPPQLTAPRGDFRSEIYIAAPLVAALPVGHRLASETTLHLASLADEPFVLVPSTIRSRIHEAILQACTLAGFTPRVAQEADHLHLLLAFVDAGLGVTLVPGWVAEVAWHGVVFKPLEPRLPNYDLLFVWRADCTNTAVVNFREVARAINADRPSYGLGHLK